MMMNHLTIALNVTNFAGDELMTNVAVHELNLASLCKNYSSP